MLGFESTPSLYPAFLSLGQKTPTMLHRSLNYLVAQITFYLLSTCILAQAPVKLTLDLTRPGHLVSPKLYGLMTEEINYSYEGGLYGELVRNRNFRDIDHNKPRSWELLRAGDDECAMALTSDSGLRVDIKKVGGNTGIANEGYWGFPLSPGTTYTGTLIARHSAQDTKNLLIMLESKDGKNVYASTTVSINNTLQQVHFTLATAGVTPVTADLRLVITAKSAGTFYFTQVSLFPPTYNNRPNGNRADIMQLLADMKPSFLRFPGGNYLEGMDFHDRFDWKKTIGPIESRPGHMSPWGYPSTDGMGLLEFLEWCEDLHMEPLVAVFAGFVLNKDYLEAGPYLQPFVQDALDEIEYITGDPSSKWGAARARDGHPEPFTIHYVEIGNEDGFDFSGSYRQRYSQFYDAIKAKYPHLQPICTMGGKDELGQWEAPPPASKLEIVDEHYYRNANEMEENAGQFDSYDRSGPKVFVGEWATREGNPTTNFNAALGDAAWMTGMERNSDIVIMSSYAPLFVNVNPGGMQWRSDLIGYNTISSYGSPSYYAQKLFSTHIGNRAINCSVSNIPTQLQKLTARDTAEGHTQAKSIDAFFYSATIDSANGKIYLKMVNTQSTPQTIEFNLKGADKISRDALAWTLHANSPTESNSITDPQHVIPIESVVKGISKTFKQTLPPYSITVLELTQK
jgi:alpha-L-arabinofuranosidase